MRGATVFMGPLFGFTTAAYGMDQGAAAMAGAGAGMGAGMATKGAMTHSTPMPMPAAAAAPMPMVPAKSLGMGMDSTPMGMGMGMGAGAPMAQPALAPATRQEMLPTTVDMGTGAPTGNVAMPSTTTGATGMAMGGEGDMAAPRM